MRAYRATHYVVQPPAAAPLTLLVGHRSPELIGFLGPSAAARRWAFLTAYNPCSRERPEAENQAAQRALEADLRARGLSFVPGEGKSPDSPWREASVLVLDLEREDAIALGRKYGQVAIVCGQGEGPAELVVCLPLP